MDKVETKHLISKIVELSGGTQESLARELDITAVALSNLATGKSNPRLKTRKRIEDIHTQLIVQSTNMNVAQADKVYLEITDGVQVSLNASVLNENILHLIAQRLLALDDTDRSLHVKRLLLALPLGSRALDWNIGSLLQHFSSTDIIQIFKSIPQTQAYYNSIGLTWVFGEFGIRDSFIIGYLRSVVQWSSSSEAWWRAAFSLEMIGIDEAINMLKHSLKKLPLRDLSYYLNHLNDKKSIISILLLANVENIEHTIYPAIKKSVTTSGDIKVIINCCWLVGRLGIIDDQIFAHLKMLSKSRDYEKRYYTFFALQNNTSEKLRPMIEEAITDIDPLIRKIATRALRMIGSELSLPLLYEALTNEKESSIIAEISKSIYALKSPSSKDHLQMEREMLRNENGLIIDETDKWYKDAAIYDVFSMAEDPQNVCYEIIRKLVENRVIKNPIDLATGTGRMMWQIIDKIDYEGHVYGVDTSIEMCEHLKTTVRRERKFTKNIEIVHSSIEDLPSKISIKSNLIVSSFGFPSKISDISLCMRELKAVYELLSEDGLFITFGWDEMFNDELSEMWYRYIPDNMQALSFEEWRQMKVLKIKETRGCGLTWFKRGIAVPLQFSSLRDSVRIMSYLFGRDAGQHILKERITEWQMSVGITHNTKDDIKKILDIYEARN